MTPMQELELGFTLLVMIVTVTLTFYVVARYIEEYMKEFRERRKRKKRYENKRGK